MKMKMKRNLHKKVMKKSNNNDEVGLQSYRFLITVNIMGSSGPLRFVVKEDDLVCEIIHTSLKSYAREARLPLLGSDSTNFLLYCTNTQNADGSLSPMEKIGSKQARNFVMCKKACTPSPLLPDKMVKKLMTTKENRGWKAWINKSLSCKILS